MSELNDQPRFSDAALSVHKIIPPSRLAEGWVGEPYAIQLTDENDQPVWYPAYDDIASLHGNRHGWDHVAAVVPPGTVHTTEGGAR